MPKTKVPYFFFGFPALASRNIADMVALFFRVVQLGKQGTEMLHTPVTLIGLAGVVFLAGSFTPVSFNIASLGQSQGLLRHVAAGSFSGMTKGDRIAEPRPAEDQLAVSIVEFVGTSQTTVILRDHHGKVLYRSDPRSGITTLSKNTELPVVARRNGREGPAELPPVTRQEGTETPQDQKQKLRNPVGCMRDVSPLVKASAGRMPSLCLASLDQSFS